MRYVLSVDIEDTAEIEAFLQFVRFHSKRLKCPEKDVIVRLAKEFQAQDQIFDYAKLKAQAEAEAKTVAPKSVGIKRKHNVNGRGPL